MEHITITTMPNGDVRLTPDAGYLVGVLPLLERRYSEVVLLANSKEAQHPERYYQAVDATE